LKVVTEEDLKEIENLKYKILIPGGWVYN